MQDFRVHWFAQALLPLLISRLPDPFNPTEADAKRVVNAALDWAEWLDQFKQNGQYAMIFDD